MWLLSTARAELQHFASPKQAAEAGFAILSHVWNEKEQTFQETQALAAQCDADHSNPRDRSTPKVRQSCEFAENQDFDWIWNDACCIDKTSSSELSEAINSMFTYYSLAEVCYAYLEDVPSADNSIASYRQLRSSRWFRRGWTLQELIAPDQVLFLSRDWTAIGTKAELSATLETITKIPIPVLRSPENIRNYSIAQRMSWAAERETTREEDEAYCLMGIFDINMPALYGEGRNAFQRLQEEIMKKSVDTSLFAWGGLIKGPHFNHTDFSPYDNAVFGDNPCVYLLARSPSAFLLSSLYEYDTDTLVRLDALPQQHSKQVTPFPFKQNNARIPEFTIKSYGVRAHLPVIERDGFRIAVLFVSCQRQGPLGLLLTPCAAGVDPGRHLYYTSVVENAAGPRRHYIVRLLPLSSLRNQQAYHLQWTDLYILPAPRRTPHNLKLDIPMNFSTPAPFRIPRRYLLRLQAAQIPHIMLPKPFPSSWNRDTPARLALCLERKQGYVTVLELHLGRCAIDKSPREQSTHAHCGAHWAFFQLSQAPDVPVNSDWWSDYNKRGLPRHSCTYDHVDGWTGGKRQKSFEFRRTMGTLASTLTFTVTFSRCPDSPTETYVVSLTMEESMEPSTLADSDPFAPPRPFYALGSQYPPTPVSGTTMGHKSSTSLAISITSSAISSSLSILELGTEHPRRPSLSSSRVRFASESPAPSRSRSMHELQQPTLDNNLSTERLAESDKRASMSSESDDDSNPDARPSEPMPARNTRPHSPYPRPDDLLLHTTADAAELSSGSDESDDETWSLAHVPPPIPLMQAAPDVITSHIDRNRPLPLIPQPSPHTSPPRSPLAARASLESQASGPYAVVQVQQNDVGDAASETSSLYRLSDHDFVEELLQRLRPYPSHELADTSELDRESRRARREPPLTILHAYRPPSLTTNSRPPSYNAYLVDPPPSSLEELESRLRPSRTSRRSEADGMISLSAPPAVPDRAPGSKTGRLKSFGRGLVDRILGRHRGQRSKGARRYPDYDHDWAVWASAEHSDSELWD